MASTRFNIQTSGTVDFNKIKIDSIKTNKYGGRSARINYDGGRFLIQTPRLRLPYGLGVYEEKDAEGRVVKTKYSLDFSFSGYKSDERNSEKPLVKRFFTWMEKFEDFVKDEAKKNSYNWVQDPDATEHTIRALFRPIIKHHRDKTTGKVTGLYPPTMKANVGFWDGRFTMDVYDQNQQPMDDPRTALMKGAEALAILSIDAVTFAGGKFGVKFNIQQVKVFLPDSLRGTYAFNDAEDDEYDPSAPKAALPEPVKEPTSSTFVEEEEEEEEEEVEDDEDLEAELEDELEDELEEEEEEEEEPEPEPEPEPTPKKKSGRKTAKKTPAKTAAKKGRAKKST